MKVGVLYPINPDDFGKKKGEETAEEIMERLFLQNPSVQNCIKTRPRRIIRKQSILPLPSRR